MVDVRIAGAPPPLRGSYRADLVGPFEELEPAHREQAEILGPYVDIFLRETMSSAAEGLACAATAASTGKPVGVSGTLREDRSGRLRSDETAAEAVAALATLPVVGYLANCCPPESITAAMAALAGTGVAPNVGDASIFTLVPEDWTLDGGSASDGLIGLRENLDPDAYAAHAAAWIDADATVGGGGTRPAHIARLPALVDGRGPDRGPVSPARRPG